MNIANKKHAKVVELYKMGIEIEQIAIQTGYASNSSISEIASRYGCELRRPIRCNGERDAEILRMSLRGMSAKQIGLEIGLSHSTVSEIVSRERAAIPEDEPSDKRIKAWSCSPEAIARAVAKLPRRGVSA